MRAPSTRLNDCYLRLNRADEQSKAVNEMIQRFLKGAPYALVPEFDMEHSRYILRAQISQDPPRELGILIGEVVHHLRGALDWLAYLLASRDGREPPVGTEFPIFTDRTAFLEQTRKGAPARGSGLYKMRGMSTRAQAVIKSLQPYHRRDEPERDPLATIHALDVADKHHNLTVVGSVLEQATFELLIHRPDLESAPHYITHSIHRSIGPFNHGTVVASVDTSSWTPNTYMHVHDDQPFGIAFDPEGPAGDLPVPWGLLSLRTYVRQHIFEHLAHFVR